MFFKRRKFPDFPPRTKADDFLWLARMSDDRYFTSKNFDDTLKETPEAATWKDARGVTGLMAASEGDEKNHVSSLISAGADIHARDDSGDTALLYAARAAHMEILELLLDSGADINAANSKGETSLMIAAGGYNRDALELLLKRGADTERRNAEGRTALQTAEARFTAASASPQTMFTALNTEGPIIDMLRNAAEARQATQEILSGADHSVTVHKPLKLTLKHKQGA